MRGWDSVVKPEWVPSLLLAIGGVLIGVTLGEVGLWYSRRSVTQLTFLTGVVTSLPFAALLAGGAYWLPTSSISASRYPTIGLWSIGGLIFIGSFFAVIGVGWFPGDPLSQLGMLRWGTAVGAGGGFLVGTLNARGIERTVDAERAAVRAEEARRQQELLEYLNAVLRHEVLNTANVVSGYADIIEEDLEDHPEVTEQIEIIQRQTEELTNIITDVRVLLSAVEGSDELERVNLTEVLTGELQNLQDRHDVVETTAELPEEVVVWGDDMLRRLFINLFENAVEHNHSDTPEVTVSVSVGEEMVRVAVTDNGPGIPAGMRDELFDPVPDTDSDHGLGLTIVTRLVDRYEGEIDLTDTGEDGTTFTVSLPRAPSEG